MKESILITGATGSLAKYLSYYLSRDFNLKFLTTKKNIVDNKKYFYWNIEKEFIDDQSIKNCKYIIHLAGYSILNRWTSKNKKLMYDSRVKSTKLLYNLVKQHKVNIQAFICASAIGIYENSTDIINEDSTLGNSWLSNLAKDWEDSANKFKVLDCRVVLMRISLIFSKKDGFLKYNLLSMKLGIGAILGKKNGIINWMHIEDIARFIKFCIENKKLIGPFNLTVPEKISQYDFYLKMKKHIFFYALIFKIPNLFIRLLLGSRSEIFLSTFNLSSKKIESSGFRFKYFNSNKLIDNITSKKV